MHRLVLLFALAAPELVGCIKMTKVGVATGSIAPESKVPVACIEDRSGAVGSLVLGKVQGKPAVQPDGVRLGVTPIMSEPVEVDGLTVFAAQECLDQDQPLCDTTVYLRKGSFHYALYWAEQYPTREARPKDTRTLVDFVRGRGLVSVLGDLEVDAPTIAEVAKLAKARASRRTWQWVKFAVAETLAKSSPKLMSSELAQDMTAAWKKDAMTIQFQVDETEAPIIRNQPKVGAVFAAARLATGASAVAVASMCVGPATEAP